MTGGRALTVAIWALALSCVAVGVSAVVIVFVVRGHG